MDDFRKKYKTIMDDHFPESMQIIFGDQRLEYRKKSWKIPDSSGSVIEKGLRYGENPGQEAALYELVGGNLVLGGCRFIEPGNGLVSSITESEMIQAGKHPGKTNLTDVDNALNILKFMMHKPACAIMKHNNPSGAAIAESLNEAYHRANMADRIAAFGGAAVFNRPVDKATAHMISENYLEVVAAPDYEEGAIEVLAKRKNLRIVAIQRIHSLGDYLTTRFVEFKSLLDGGVIVQQSALNAIHSSDDLIPARATHKGIEYAVQRHPTDSELDDMVFGWAVEQGVTSNSVLYVKDGCTVGIGTGEQDRVGVAEIAVFKAYVKYRDRLCFERYQTPYSEMKDQALRDSIDAETSEKKAGLIGSVMISDAFFPFRDGVEVGIREGISAVVHPGGSERDYESIQACNEADPQVTMMFTNQRAFKH
ncbi:MAG: IMP cyclohydrolase [Desulfomonile tiedjei]|uniref:IMP cyclohydrolase n=1 Tax=Desulfomonile tiedjei TaxID=2358 RepID=A0A9D6UY15_9BACT|nr:IMP cyclohydrolase [Desulfomonile tiedjei]